MGGDLVLKMLDKEDPRPVIPKACLVSTTSTFSVL
jgi:hypothetical protein